MILLIVVGMALPACKKQVRDSDSKTSASVINPNGDSELALLMRDMYFDAERMKEQIAMGKTLSSDIDYKAVLTAHATEPDKAASETYKVYGKAYIKLMEELENASDDNKPDLYNNLISTCVNCHQELCPGPVKKIKKLY